MKFSVTNTFSMVIMGVALMLPVLIFEISAHILGTVSYILIVLYLLWTFRHHKRVGILGIIATTFMVVGFAWSIEDFVYIDSLIINRFLAMMTIWLAVFFTVRYRRLHRTEQRYKGQLKALFENTMEGMVFTNSRGEMVLVNPCAEKMFGCKKEELLGQSIEALIPYRYREHHVALRDEFISNPANRPMNTGHELYGIRKDGVEFPIDVSLCTYYEDDELHIIAFIVDITERKKNEEIIAENYRITKDLNQQLESRVQERTIALENALASVRQFNSILQREIEERKTIADRLKKSQQLYSAIAGNFPEGIIAVIDEDLRYIFVEGKDLSLITSVNESRFGAHLTGDIPLTQEQEAVLRRTFSGESVSFDFTQGDKHFDVLCTPLPEGSDKIKEILIVIRDVTKFKMLESNLLKLLNRERELNAMKSRFVTIASHEFRTPLTTILSSTFLLENYAAADFEVKKKTHFDRIKRSVNTLTDLLNDFLSLGKLEEGKVKASYTEVNINDELEEFVKEIETVKKKEQRIMLDCSGNGTTVMLDKKIVRNILNNLVSNAIKYSPVDGEITIGAELSENHLKIRITDNGIGIPEKEQRHIFKRFYRAHNAMNFEGTGLGLNIVRRYVRMLQGTIGFKSKPDKGTTFYVTLPVQTIVKETIDHGKAMDVEF